MSSVRHLPGKQGINHAGDYYDSTSGSTDKWIEAQIDFILRDFMIQAFSMSDNSGNPSTVITPSDVGRIWQRLNNLSPNKRNIRADERWLLLLKLTKSFWFQLAPMDKGVFDLTETVRELVSRAES